MAKNEFTIIAEYGGKYYVKIAAFMGNPLCAMIDGLPIVTFEDDDNLYYPIDQAIEWVQKEIQENKHYAERMGNIVLKGLLKAKEQEQNESAQK